MLPPLLSLLLATSPTPACEGPGECCITDPAQVTAVLPEHVRVGLRWQRIRSLDEHSGLWTGEIILVTRWPAGGLRPDVTVRNANGDLSVPVDETTHQGAYCFRERRLAGSFANWFRLRRFPFDRQLVRLLLEERALTDAQAIWEPELWPNVISIDAYRELPGWRFSALPVMEVKRTSFSVASDAPHARLLIVSLPLERLWLYYLSRYFLPLVLIVALSYSLFWIKQDDLSSASSIGITCLLAIIAFQLTQASSLPQVEYLTLADRVYVVCYAAATFALAMAVVASRLSNVGRLSTAENMYRRLRLWFPIVFIVGCVIAGVSGWLSHSEDLDADVPYVVPAAHPPPGETG